MSYEKNIESLFSKIHSVYGEIVEIGVFQGRNSLLFSKLIKQEEENGFDDIDPDLPVPDRLYIGFDTFEGYTEEDIETSPNSEGLRRNQNSKRWHYSAEAVEDMLRDAGVEFIAEIIEGDVKETFPNECDCMEGIAMLYIDCNAYLPAIHCMKEAVPHLREGSLIVIDEHQTGGETKALEEFASEYNLEIIDTGFKYPNGPSKYVVWK